MIREFRFVDWKSYTNATLRVEPLTIVIGTNASGKSNALDAIEFLKRTAGAAEINSALAGDSTSSVIRGGIEWAAKSGTDRFAIEVVVAGDDERTDYEYAISVIIHGNTAELYDESLTRVIYQGANPRRLRLFWTDEPDLDSPGITSRLYNTKSGSKQPLRRNMSVLSQLEVFEVRDEISTGIKIVLGALRNIFILDPNPSAMRAYSRPSERLKTDGSNIAGVLAALPEPTRERVQAKLTTLTKSIPEKDITRVWAQTVDRLGLDAMLYCEERWGKAMTREVDARGLSDGTLRYIAIMTTLLTQPEGSLVVIEEIDNGLHPSRAELLLNSLRTIGAERRIDIVVTTHNVALLDALSPETIRAVTVAYRNEQDGASELELMNDIPSLSRLLAEGPLGRLSAEGKVEEAVRRRSVVG